MYTSLLGLRYRGVERVGMEVRTLLKGIEGVMLLSGLGLGNYFYVGLKVLKVTTFMVGVEINRVVG
jgi:hypothetical protein